MHLAYFDESVDPEWFVLATVIMHEEHWRNNLDAALALRRRARTNKGIPITAELKATHIRKGTGPLETLGMQTDERGELFNSLLRWQDKHLKLNVWAVAINKSRLDAGKDSREFAWKYSVERVETFCRKAGSRAVMFPDAGHGYFIRRMVRKMRRFDLIQGRFGGVLDRKAERILEDPNDRQSHESLFIQLADWNAFAALRSKYIAPRVASFADAWDFLGDSRVQVESITAALPHFPGIKVFPK